MDISAVYGNSYSAYTQSTKKTASGVDAAGKTSEMSEAEKLEAFKKEIWNEINAIPRSSSISWSINITDAAFDRMMNEPEFKEKMMGLIREDAAAGRPPIVCSITTIDENGYKGYSYNDMSVGKAAYSAHSKDKDNFYKQKAKEQDYIELWEEKRLERERQREELDKEYVDKMYFNRGLLRKEQASAAYEANVLVEPVGSSGFDSETTGANV